MSRKSWMKLNWQRRPSSCRRSSQVSSHYPAQYLPYLHSLPMPVLASKYQRLYQYQLASTSASTPHSPPCQLPCPVPTLLTVTAYTSTSYQVAVTVPVPLIHYHAQYLPYLQSLLMPVPVSKYQCQYQSCLLP